MTYDTKQKKYTRIVITGGPSSGKTTVIDAVRSKFGKLIHIVPETALLLARGGFPMLSPENWVYDWQLSFQDAVHHTQLAVESATELMLSDSKNTIIIYDRGLLDGAAYFNETIDEFEERYKVRARDIASRYDLIINFDSIANYGLEYFNKYCSSEKFHDYKQSLEYDKRSRIVWSMHSNLHIVESRSIDEKIYYVTNQLNTILGLT